jgi:hypothetical protein
MTVYDAWGEALKKEHNDFVAVWEGQGQLQGSAASLLLSIGVGVKISRPGFMSNDE